PLFEALLHDPHALSIEGLDQAVELLFLGQDNRRPRAIAATLNVNRGREASGSESDAAWHRLCPVAVDLLKSIRSESPTTSRFYQLPLSSLLALVALASLLPVALLAAYGLQGYFARERAGELDKLSARAESLAHAVDRELRGY